MDSVVKCTIKRTFLQQLQPPSLNLPAVFVPAKLLPYIETNNHVTNLHEPWSSRTAENKKSNMADRAIVRNLCKSLFSSRFSSINAKSIRYFTRYLSSRANNLREEESRISFITDGCSIEELENVQDLVDGNLEVRENFISEEEESLLLKEVEPYLKRQKYQYDHWDDVSVLAVKLHFP